MRQRVLSLSSITLQNAFGASLQQGRLQGRREKTLILVAATDGRDDSQSFFPTREDPTEDPEDKDPHLRLIGPGASLLRHGSLDESAHLQACRSRLFTPASWRQEQIKTVGNSSTVALSARRAGQRESTAPASVTSPGAPTKKHNADVVVEQ